MVRTLPTIETERGNVVLRVYDSERVRAFPDTDDSYTNTLYAAADYVEVMLYDYDDELRPTVHLRMDGGPISTSFLVDESVADRLVNLLDEYDAPHEVNRA